MIQALADFLLGLAKAGFVLGGIAAGIVAAAYGWCVMRHNRLPGTVWEPAGPDGQDMNRLTKPVQRRPLSTEQRRRIMRRFVPFMSTLSASMLVIGSAIVAPIPAPAVELLSARVPTETFLVKPENILSAEDLETIQKASEMKHVERFPGRAWNNANNRRDEWLASDRSIKPGSNRAYAVLSLEKHGWGLKHWACLDRLWWHESGWSPTGGHPERAYGIPQAFPGSKMAREGKDWRVNPKTQIDWGLEYIKDRYGSPCEAFETWSDRASRGYGWY